MKRIITLLLLLSTVGITYAQSKQSPNKINLSNRTSDHLLIQFGYDNWGNKPDSISTKGFSRFFNMYFMLDKPFKSNPHFSVAYGIGVGSSNIFFQNTIIDIAGKISTNKINFQNADKINHYKKYKLVNAWAEIPFELRYASNPENLNKSWKVAIGGKIGTMLNAHTKGKTVVDSSGNVLNGQTKTIDKVNNRGFFNSTRIAATIRIGYGHFSVYGAYQVNSLFKEGSGPEVRPYSIGLCLSGL